MFLKALESLQWLSGQAPESANYESANYVLLECEPLDTIRMRMFAGKQPGVEQDAGLGCKILELVKFTGVGWPNLGSTMNLVLLTWKEPLSVTPK